MSKVFSDDLYKRLTTGQLQDFIKACSIVLKHISKEKVVEGVSVTKSGNVRFRVDRGLCDLVAQVYRDVNTSASFGVSSYLQYGFERWELYSGSMSYPVPASRTNISEGSACRAYEDLNHWEGEQLLMRQELMTHILVTAKSFL